MIDPYVAPDPTEGEPAGPTDFASLTAAVQAEPSLLPPIRRNFPTDFASLTADRFADVQREVPHTLADYLIDAITPLLIFIMVNALIMYLLNVRYVYTAVHDMNLRTFSFFFVLGVVALNRVIARSGSNESIVYTVLLFMVVILYTVATSEAYGVGSVARNFLNDSTLMALLVNLSVVLFIWWLVNRLTHECCVDESSVAGDIGIFTATAERFRYALQRASVSSEEIRNRQLRTDLRPAEINESWDTLSVYDPTTDALVQAVTEKQEKKYEWSVRLPHKHPGMALFYFSVPVMIAFTLGLRVIQHLGTPAVRMGAFYMTIYTFCVLTLLTLTCLRQLRAYFRLRRVVMPSVLPLFWLAASLPMILLIMWGAAALPMPAPPPPAYVDYHQTDVWNPTSFNVELLDVTPPLLTQLDEMHFQEGLERAFRVVVVLLLIYAGIKILQQLVELGLDRRQKLPPWLNSLISLFAWIIFRLWPDLFRWTFAPRRIRIQRGVALSSRYDNPFKQNHASPMAVRNHVIYAYEALRALAVDVGAPPRSSQTPYEFLEEFPKQLERLREEAEEIIRLYVIAAYSPLEMDARIEDRLRKYWMAYNVVRNYYVK